MEPSGDALVGLPTASSDDLHRAYPLTQRQELAGRPDRAALGAPPAWPKPANSSAASMATCTSQRCDARSMSTPQPPDSPSKSVFATFATANHDAHRSFRSAPGVDDVLVSLLGPVR
jgi:hypothetical protein